MYMVPQLMTFSGILLLTVIGTMTIWWSIVRWLRIFKDGKEIARWNKWVQQNRAQYPVIEDLERRGIINEHEAIDRMISLGRDKVRGKAGAHYPSRYDFQIIRTPEELVLARWRVRDRAEGEARIRQMYAAESAKNT